jgi:uncharacterized protein YjhX (UPF0386 family)
MLGSRAGVAATFGGIGFHERDARRQVEQAVTRGKIEMEQEKMGRIIEILCLTDAKVRCNCVIRGYTNEQGESEV